MVVVSYLGISAANALSVSTEGGNQVGGGQKTILVSVHDTEGLLKLLDSGVGERFEDVSFLRHFGGLCWWYLVVYLNYNVVYTLKMITSIAIIYNNIQCSPKNESCVSCSPRSGTVRSTISSQPSDFPLCLRLWLRWP